MAIKVQGYKGVVEVPQTITYGGKTGWKTARVFEGPSNSIKQLAASLVNEYGQTITVSIDPMDANLAKLTATFDRLEGDKSPDATDSGSKEEETASWTLSGQNMELSIWQHPQVKWLADNCVAEYSWLRQNLKICQDKGTFNEVLLAYTATSSCAIQVKTILRLFRDGTQNYQHSAYVISRQATIRTDAQGTIATGNVNRIFTKAQLSSIEGMPSTMAFAVPNIQWLKSTPTITYQGGKLSASNEWVGADEWSTFLYYNAS